ncbi:uncharacterized protein LOC100397459 isoform X12 [Callithrix jacchus]
MCPQLAGAGSMGSPGATVGWGLLDYKMEKYVMTRNWRVGTLQRLLQLGIVIYVVGTCLIPSPFSEPHQGAQDIVLNICEIWSTRPPERPPAVARVGSPHQKRLPGAGPGAPGFHHHQTQRGFRDSDQGAWKPAVGCG